MAMGRMKPQQGEFWIAADALKTPGHPFFRKLNEVLEAQHFDEKVESLCLPYYTATYGRPSIPPGRYFRMLMIGYFEGMTSERGLAWRCDDSLSLKAFLGLSPVESSPDHSALSLMRRRLPVEVFDAVNKLVLGMLKEAGLLHGRVVAIDSSTMDANAAMSSIARKDTLETYSEYIARLAGAAGEPAETREDLAAFDKKRADKDASNAEWQSTTDPDAKVARTKDGRTHMAYKPEHVVDAESGAVIAAVVHAADASDHTTAASTLVQAISNMEAVGVPTVQVTVIADKGYYSEALIAGCAVAELKTCIAEPRVRGKRRWKRKCAVARRAMQANRRRVRSGYGKRLLRQRGETVERSFAHMLDTGGLRRTYLRGLANNAKRYLLQVSAFNLGLVMRQLCGFGTPRGLAAAAAAAVLPLIALVAMLRDALRALRRHGWQQQPISTAHILGITNGQQAHESTATSTGC